MSIETDKQLSIMRKNTFQLLSILLSLKKLCKSFLYISPSGACATGEDKLLWAQLRRSFPFTHQAF